MSLYSIHWYWAECLINVILVKKSGTGNEKPSTKINKVPEICWFALTLMCS